MRPLILFLLMLAFAVGADEQDEEPKEKPFVFFAKPKPDHEFDTDQLILDVFVRDRVRLKSVVVLADGQPTVRVSEPGEPIRLEKSDEVPATDQNILDYETQYWNFKATVTLAIGTHTITVAAVNDYDLEARETVRVKRVEAGAIPPPKAEPSVRPDRAPVSVPTLEPDRMPVTKLGSVPEDQRQGELFYTNRAKDYRTKRAGGATTRAVTNGLQWLALHQADSGAWDCDKYYARCTSEERCQGAGKPFYDEGVTGLALLAFLGAGCTHEDGEHQETVRRGLRYLLDQQHQNGAFGNRESGRDNYCHAICTLAVTEAHGMTRDPALTRSAQKGIDFLHASKNPGAAWKYGIRPGDNDMSVTAWALMALKAGFETGLTIQREDIETGWTFLQSMTDPKTGRVGYAQKGSPPTRFSFDMQARFPPEYSESLTAAGMFCRVLLGSDPERSTLIKRGALLCLEHPPEWEDPKLDYYYWFFGSHAMYQVSRPAWRRWSSALQKAVLRNQSTDNKNCSFGSWYPVDVWGEEGGRVYSTAMLTLCLEASFRYPRLFE